MTIPFFKKQPLTLHSVNAQLLDLLSKRDGLRAQIALAEASAAESLLDDESVASLADDTSVALAAQLARIGRAIALLESQRAVAIAAEWAEEARLLHAECAEKQEALDHLQAATSRSLAELSRLEGINYGPGILERQADTNGLTWAVPRSSQMKATLARLRETAETLASRAVPRSGTFDQDFLTSTTDVLEKLLLLKAVIPSLDDVTNWLDACQKAAGARRFEASQRRVFMVWTAGGIDLRASYVFVRAFSVKSARGYDVAAATFRAAIPESRHAA